MSLTWNDSLKSVVWSFEENKDTNYSPIADGHSLTSLPAIEVSEIKKKIYSWQMRHIPL